MVYQMIIILSIGCVVGASFLFFLFHKIKNRFVTLFWGGELTLIGGIVLLSNKNADFMRLLGLFLIIFGIVLSIIATVRNFPED